MMSEPRRLHPIAAVSNVLKTLKDSIIPILIIVVFGNSEGKIQLFITIGIIALILISGILTWLRFTYRIEEGELRIESGLIIRKKRYIPFERIQSLDLSEGILQRPFGLVKMTIETAGSGLEAEAILTAISKNEAQQIQDILSQSKNAHIELDEQIETEQKEEQILYQIKPGELILLSSTSGGVGVVISAVFAFLSQFAEVIPYEKVFDELSVFITGGVMLISLMVFLGFVLAWLIALIGSVLKYANFTVRKVGEELVITRGLLEKKQLTIPLHRIQALRINENPVRQAIGYASVYLESAGGSLKDADSSKVMLLPLIKRNRIREKIETGLNDYQLTDMFVPAPKRALRRYILRGLFISVPVAVILLYFFSVWGLFSLVFVGLMLILSYYRYKAAGWTIIGNQLVLRSRFISKTTVYLRKNRTQSISMKETYFQKQNQLATISAKAMSGSGATGGDVVDLEVEDVLSIYKWYSYTPENTE